MIAKDAAINRKTQNTALKHTCGATKKGKWETNSIDNSYLHNFFEQVELIPLGPIGLRKISNWSVCHQGISV